MSARVSCRSAIALTAVIVALFALSVPVDARTKFTARPLLVRREASSGRVADRPPRPLRRIAAPAPREAPRSRSWSGSTSTRSRATREVSSGLRATSPGLTGDRSVTHPSRVRAYERYLATRMASIADAIRRSVPGARLLRTYTVVYGGASHAGAGRQHPRPPAGAGRRGRPARPSGPHDDDDHSAFPRRRSGVAEPRRSRSRRASNVVVGVLDTGIWPEHPSFEDLGLGSVPAGRRLRVRRRLRPGPRCAVRLQSQADRRVRVHRHLHVPRRRARPESSATTTPAECSARDADGHGTHTASTAAGAPTKASVFGLPRGRVSGIAPGRASSPTASAWTWAATARTR